MRHSKSKGKILFIEDEIGLVNIYHDYLTENGYEFFSTKDITEALAFTISKRPDLVLLDIIIPKPDNTVAEQGWEYLEAVKKNKSTRDIPVLVFTNLDTPEDRQKSQNMGAAGFIFKCDCKPEEVMAAIAQVIQLYRTK